VPRSRIPEGQSITLSERAASRSTACHAAAGFCPLRKPRLGVPPDATAGFKAQIVHPALTSKLFIAVD
jgi:hypothetical protein